MKGEENKRQPATERLVCHQNWNRLISGIHQAHHFFQPAANFLEESSSSLSVLSGKQEILSSHKDFNNQAHFCSSLIKMFICTIILYKMKDAFERLLIIKLKYWSNVGCFWLLWWWSCHRKGRRGSRIVPLRADNSHEDRGNTGPVRYGRNDLQSKGLETETEKGIGIVRRWD